MKILALAFIVLAAMSANSLADEQRPDFLFERFCPHQIERFNEDGKHRLCTDFYRLAWKNKADPALFLRSRLTHMINTSGPAADWSLTKFVAATWVVAALGLLVAIGKILTLPFISQTRTVLIAVAAALVALIGAFGWNTQYKAEFAAARAASALRDMIDAEHLEAYANTLDAPGGERLQDWLGRYETILTEHAATYAGSFSVIGPPTID